MTTRSGDPGGGAGGRGQGRPGEVRRDQGAPSGAVGGVVPGDPDEGRPQPIGALAARVRAHLAHHEVHELPAEGSRPAAVVVVVTADPERGVPSFLLTRRAARLRGHAGQWALPGGRCDAGEPAAETARRECAEELGLRLQEAELLGRLDDYRTRSGYLISPFVAVVDRPVRLVPAAAEVAAVHHVPLADLERPDSPRFVRIPESDRPVVQLPLLGTLLHAPTAAVLLQFREVALHGRPTRVAHLEQPVFAWR